MARLRQLSQRLDVRLLLLVNLSKHALDGLGIHIAEVVDDDVAVLQFTLHHFTSLFLDLFNGLHGCSRIVLLSQIIISNRQLLLNGGGFGPFLLTLD